MDTRHPLARHGEHAEGVIAAQIFLDRERKFLKVAERLEISRMNTSLIEHCPIMRDIVVSVAKAPLEAR